jgi:hypothetical protein
MSLNTRPESHIRQWLAQRKQRGKFGYRLRTPSRRLCEHFNFCAGTTGREVNTAEAVAGRDSDSFPGGIETTIEQSRMRFISFCSVSRKKKVPLFSVLYRLLTFLSEHFVCFSFLRTSYQSFTLELQYKKSKGVFLFVFWVLRESTVEDVVMPSSWCTCLSEWLLNLAHTFKVRQ